jgi:hypothetical protein
MWVFHCRYGPDLIDRSIRWGAGPGPPPLNPSSFPLESLPSPGPPDCRHVLSKQSHCACGTKQYILMHVVCKKWVWLGTHRVSPLQPWNPGRTSFTMHTTTVKKWGKNEWFVGRQPLECALLRLVAIGCTNWQYVLVVQLSVWCGLPSSWTKI